MKGYPRGFRGLLLASLGLLLVTGLLLAPTTLMLRTEWSVPWRLPGEGRIGVAALHCALGFLGMMLVGALWTGHMRSGWRRRRQRASGALAAGSMLVLTLTAVGVYYLGEEGAGTIAALAHLGIGLALVAVFGWHWWHGHRHARHLRRPGIPAGPRSAHRPKTAKSSGRRRHEPH